LEKSGMGFGVKWLPAEDVVSWPAGEKKAEKGSLFNVKTGILKPD
jgi:hypothetical protein